MSEPAPQVGQVWDGNEGSAMVIAVTRFSWDGDTGETHSWMVHFPFGQVIYSPGYEDKWPPEGHRLVAGPGAPWEPPAKA